MNDVTKLPKWAQEHIRSLETRLINAEHKLRIVQLDSTNNGSGIIKMTYGLNTEVVLNDHATIEFKVDWRRIRVSLTSCSGDCFVDVNGDSHIYISPRAANSCYIR